MQLEGLRFGSLQPLRLAEPHVLHRLLEAHPLLLLLEQSEHEVLREVAVFAPGWALEGRLASDDVLDGAGVVL